MQVRPIVTFIDFGRANLSATAAETAAEISCLQSLMDPQVTMGTCYVYLSCHMIIIPLVPYIEIP